MRTILLLLISINTMSQGCDNPYPLGLAGTYGEECWGNAFEDTELCQSADCFDAWPYEDLCGPYCYASYMSFEVGTSGTVAITIGSDLNYDHYPTGPELYVHFYVLTSCYDPVYYTGTCGGELLGDSGNIFISSNAESNNGVIDSDYMICLALDPGSYILAVAGSQVVSTDYCIEGCLTVSLFSPGLLGLDVWTNEVNQGKTRKPYKLWLLDNYTILGQKLNRSTDK